MRFSDWLIPLKQPSRRCIRRDRQHARRQRVAAVLETLEDRVMLSGVTAESYEQVDPDWFASLGGESTASLATGPSGAYGHGQGVAAGDPEFTNRWIVRMTSDGVAQAPEVRNVLCVLDTGAHALKIVRGLGLPGQVLVDSSADTAATAANIQAMLLQHPLVSSVEPDLGVGGQDILPDDTFFADQVGLHNTGQSNARVDADIDAPLAWETTTGNSDVVVAVVDSGVDYLHQDLVNNIWVNPGEVAGNGIDDDNNGFIDDVHGYDFHANDADPMDENRHGTHVAGIVAATGNNGMGISGVSWSSTVMPLRFLGADNSGLTSDAVRAINYATMMRSEHGDDAVVGQGGDDSVKGQGGTDTLAGGSGGGVKDSGDVLSDATAGEIDEAFSLDFDDLIGQTN